MTRSNEILDGVSKPKVIKNTVTIQILPNTNPAKVLTTIEKHLISNARKEIVLTLVAL